MPAGMRCCCKQLNIYIGRGNSGKPAIFNEYFPKSVKVLAGLFYNRATY